MDLFFESLSAEQRVLFFNAAPEIQIIPLSKIIKEKVHQQLRDLCELCTISVQNNDHDAEIKAFEELRAICKNYDFKVLVFE